MPSRRIGPARLSTLVFATAGGGMKEPSTVKPHAP